MIFSLLLYFVYKHDKYTHNIRAHLWYQWEMFFFPTDFTDLHGFVFLVAANALGIGAASFWSGAEKDIAESPTAIAGTPKIMYN